MTLNYLGYMLADKGIRLPEALKMIRKAVDLEPMNGAYLDSLGWAYFKLGEYELAEDNLRQAVSATRPIPPFTIIWATCTKRPAASAWPPRSGSSRWTSSPSPHRRHRADRRQPSAEEARERARQARQTGRQRPSCQAGVSLHGQLDRRSIASAAGHLRARQRQSSSDCTRVS